MNYHIIISNTYRIILETVKGILPNVQWNKNKRNENQRVTLEANDCCTVRTLIVALIDPGNCNISKMVLFTFFIADSAITLKVNRTPN